MKEYAIVNGNERLNSNLPSCTARAATILLPVRLQPGDREEQAQHLAPRRQLPARADCRTQQVLARAPGALGPCHPRKTWIEVLSCLPDSIQHLGSEPAGGSALS